MLFSFSRSDRRGTHQRRHFAEERWERHGEQACVLLLESGCTKDGKEQDVMNNRPQPAASLGKHYSFQLTCPKARGEANLRGAHRRPA